jgi:hypothetical protein
LATACCDGTFQTCRKTGKVQNYTSYMTGAAQLKNILSAAKM